MKQLQPSNKKHLFSKLLITLLSISVLSFSQLAIAAKLSVKTDRQVIEVGDILTLIIQADFQTRGSQLDLEILSDQFEVLNQQQSNQVEIINGNYKSFTRWRVQLLPKQAGKLVIPPFEFDGVKSKALPITVNQVKVDDRNRPYFLEASVDKQSVFVQEQVIYSLRFYHKGSLVNGNIRPPKFDDALSEQIKEQSVFGKTLNGKQYTVYEWKYAFYPQKSGTYKIPGPSFTGLLNLRATQKGVRAVAPPISVKVKPKQIKDGGLWLPASSVELSQKWPGMPQTVHVGDSLRRIITLKVEGLKSSQLPEIVTENGANYKVYSDDNRVEQMVTAEGVTSVLTVSQAILPTTEGSVQIPDLTVKWWNTKTNKPEVATLKTPPISIWPSNVAIPPVIQQKTETNRLDKLPSTDTETTKPSAQTPTMQSFSDAGTWLVVISLLAVMWLITFILLIRANRKLKVINEQINEIATAELDEGEKLTFSKSMCDLPLNEFYKELLRQLHNDFKIKSVDDIPNNALKGAIYQLESHLFGNSKLGYKTMQEICDNWAGLIQRQNEIALENKIADLESLYKS